MNNNLQMQLAFYKPIKSYTPQMGDFIIWHGYFTHYYGIIIGKQDNAVILTTAGLPQLLFTDEDDRKEKIVKISRIKNSHGAFAILQGNVWYV